MKITTDYILNHLKIIPTKNLFPHEMTRPSHVYSIRAAMNSIDPQIGKRLSPLPI